MSPHSLTLSFDIGHASIGWAVFRTADALPEILGTGTVLFPNDSCLASTRRAFRRSRRNIAACRSRVAHLKNYLNALGVLTREQLDANPNSYPWLLAARVLASNGAEKLSWQELWTVLRWYAHNRGYDGNALWAGDSLDEEESISEDTQKVEAARALMERYGKTTMAETFCAALELDPLGEKKASRIYFKGNNAAFPRNDVVAEVRRILNAHLDVLPKLDPALVDCLTLSVPDEIRSTQNLPARFSNRGGLLFGQYVPRFNNRIIGKCRITGKNVPLKNCREYLLYRWGRLMNNLTVFDIGGNVRVLLPREREALHAKMLEVGFFNKITINAALKEVSGCNPANTESYFLTEEMEDALVLDPVKKLIASKYIKDFWKYFSARGKKIFATKLARGKPLKLSDCIKQMQVWGDWQEEAQFFAVLEVLQNAENKKKSGKRRNLKNLKLKADFPSGRASYCREILKKTFDEALAGIDSTKDGGCLYETEASRERLLGRLSETGNSDGTEKWIASQTNNHMVRHRLLIFSRLLEDIVKEYADGNAENIGDVVIEVIRELKEFSGLSSQELKPRIEENLKNFRHVLKKLEKAASDCGERINYSLIQKARILEDQNYECPYTGQKITYNDLFNNRLEKEHIIPRNLRISDALSSLVMTFKAVNAMKGNRTALKFIKDCEDAGGAFVLGTNMQIRPLNEYKEWAKRHKSRYGSQYRGFGKNRFLNKDALRCIKRAELLLLEKYDDRNADFTERDLTQTSHLNKMAIRLVKRNLNINARHLAGAVTGFVRKNLNIDECLVAAVPRMQKAARVGESDRRKLTKSEMRELSHLHHAMDAVTQGLTGLFFRTEDWELLVKRNLTERERLELHARYEHLLAFSESGKIMMKKLPEEFLKQISSRLAECRVVQHVPAKMHGMSVEQTTWSVKDGSIPVQHDTAKSLPTEFGGRTRPKKTPKPEFLKKQKWLGYGVEGKLSKQKGVVLINGNYALALDPTPRVILYFKVFPQLRALKESNQGTPPRILKPGDLVSFSEKSTRRVMKIIGFEDSARDGILVSLAEPDLVNVRDAEKESKKRMRIKSLIKNNLKILKPPYTGTPCPTM